MTFFIDPVSHSTFILDFDFKIRQSFIMLSKLKELIESNNERSNEEVIGLSKDVENLLHWATAFNNVTISEYLLKERNFHPNIFAAQLPSITVG